MQQPVIRIHNTQEALIAAAVDLFVRLGRDAVTQRGRFLIALAGGGTPIPLYEALARPPYCAESFWQQTHFFWGDERLVPLDDEGSNYGSARDVLLQHIDVPPEHFHAVRGDWAPAEAVADYRAQLAALAEADLPWPRFDLVLLGVGRDGHVASLFPASSEPASAEPVLAVTADYEGRPADRLTLTPPVFNSARHVWFLVTGADKAEAVYATLQGPKDPAHWPAQRIAPDAGSITWFLDQPAAALLH